MKKVSVILFSLVYAGDEIDTDPWDYIDMGHDWIPNP